MAQNYIAGYEKEIESLMNLNNILRNMDTYKDAGLRVPRGILLVGPPGVGKTVMAKTFAHFANHSYELRAADCIGPDPSTDIIMAFENARAIPNSVLLIDELDKITETGEHYFMECNDNVMKILLQELDKNIDNENMMIIATANDISNINKALLRPGRFDRIINIPLPNKEEREKIAHYYLGKVHLKKDINMEYFIQATEGCTGADIECIVNEAGLLAFEECEEVITNDMIRTVMARMSTGALEKEISDSKLKHIIATHEAGHAGVAYLLSNNSYIGASIIRQGDIEGRVEMCRPDETTQLDVLKTSMVVAVAGIIAEQTILGERYSIAKSDLEQAFSCAENYITVAGGCGCQYLVPHNPRLNVTCYASTPKQMMIEELIGKLIKQSMEKAKDLIENNLLFFNNIAKQLEIYKVLSEDDIKKIYEDSNILDVKPKRN